MTHQEKIEWMAMWAVRNHCALELAGEVGFGRECVGIVTDGSYPDYEWEDGDEIVSRGVWTPPDAYHKHPCVAVLGRGEDAEAQLYDWIKWFDDNGYTVEVAGNSNQNLHPVELLMGRAFTKRMVKK